MLQVMRTFRPIIHPSSSPPLHTHTTFTLTMLFELKEAFPFTITGMENIHSTDSIVNTMNSMVND